MRKAAPDCRKSGVYSVNYPSQEETSVNSANRIEQIKNEDEIRLLEVE